MADTNAKSVNRSWHILEIDPKTGRYAQPQDSQKLRVWAFRGVPIYTYAGDKKPGDIYGHANGEHGGGRNGFRAFFLRDVFLSFMN